MKKKNNIPASLQAKLDAAREFTHEEVGVKPGKLIARGTKQVNDFINRGGRPKVEDPRVNISIRIPLSYASIMRSTGAGWQTRMGEFIIDGINKHDKRLISPKV
jgi:uncharacterized protein (DUF4415 family)